MSMVPSIQNVTALDVNALNIFGSFFQEMFSNLGTGMRYLKAATDGIHLCAGGENPEILPYNGTQWVCLGANPYRHCVWYKSAYQAGREDRPSHLWLDKGAGEFPAEYPVELRQKVQLANGKLGWAHQIKQRTVWALIRTDAAGKSFIDFDNYFTFDIPATSIFAKEEAQRKGALTWLGLGQYCQTLAQQTRVPIHPAMFSVSFVQGVQVGVVFFKVGAMLPTDVLLSISEWLNSPELAKAIEVQEILHIEEPIQPAVTQPVQFAQQTQMAPVIDVPQPTAGSMQNLQTVVQPVTPAAQAAQQVSQLIQPAQSAPQATPQAVDFTALKQNLKILKH